MGASRAKGEGEGEEAVRNEMAAWEDLEVWLYPLEGDGAAAPRRGEDAAECAVA